MGSRIRALTICLGLALTAAGSAAAQTWSEYRPPDGRFRVEMPGVPKITTASVPMQGRAPAPAVQAEVETPEATYTVAYADYPADVMAKAPMTEGLIHLRDGMVRDRKLLSDKAMTMAGYHGREFVIEQLNGIVGVFRFLVVRARVYELRVATRGQGADRPLTRRFIDSFNVLQP